MRNPISQGFLAMDGYWKASVIGLTFLVAFGSGLRIDVTRDYVRNILLDDTPRSGYAILQSFVLFASDYYDPIIPFYTLACVSLWMVFVILLLSFRLHQTLSLLKFSLLGGFVCSFFSGIATTVDSMARRGLTGEVKLMEQRNVSHLSDAETSILMCLVILSLALALSIGRIVRSSRRCQRMEGPETK